MEDAQIYNLNDYRRPSPEASGLTPEEFTAELLTRGIAMSSLERQGYITSCNKETRGVRFKPIHTTTPRQ